VKKYLGVREWSYSSDGLFGSQQHNLNEKYRKSMPHINSDETKDNIYIEGDITLQTHLNWKDEFNSKQHPKSRNRIEHIREQERNYFFDTATKQKLLSTDYKPGMENHIKTSVFRKWMGNKGAIEQVLYFSNSMREENLSRDDWIAVAKNWAKHMKDKFGRVMINTQIHRDEFVEHIHSSYSCLSKNNGVLSYKPHQIQEIGYGSSLQDDFEMVFKQTIDQSKLIHSYNRGEKKKSYREVGNDHTRSKDHREQLDTVNVILDSVSDETLSIVDTLKHIRGLKEIYKGNKEALKILNKFQSGFKKLNKQQELNQVNKEELSDIEETQKKIQNAFADDLDNIEELLNFIKGNTEVANSFVRFGGERILKHWNIRKDKDKVVSVPTPMGVQQRLQAGKLKVGSKLDIKKRLANLDI